MSRNILYICIILLVLGQIATQSCKTDTTGKDAKDSLKTNNSTFQPQDYRQPIEVKYSKQAGDYLEDKFYPIGWSKKGHFAYIVEPADEAAGLYFFEFVIQNMVSGKLEFSWKNPETDSGKGNLKSTWDANYDMFKSKLNEFEIYAQENIVINPNSFTHKENQYNIKIKTKTKQSDFGFDVVEDTKVALESPQLGSKSVYEYTEKGYSMVIGQIVSGYILSPFEDRIVIVLKNERWGYEGPPNVVFFTLIGSNLNESFQKNKDK